MTHLAEIIALNLQRKGCILVKRYTHIIFDLDGTLTDPGLGITNSIMFALRKFGIEERRSALYKFIGPPLRESFCRYYGFSESKSEEAVVYYREYFEDRGIYENELYPGMYDLLHKLYDDKRKLFVATSKPQQFAERILEYFELKNFFSEVSGSNMDGSMSDKRLLIERILPGIGAENIGGAIMVGDRRYDIEGAKYHRIDTAAVLYGYSEPGELDECRPSFIVGSVDELAHLLL